MLTHRILNRWPLMRRDTLTPPDRKSTRLNFSHTEIYTLSLHDALPIYTSVSMGLHNPLTAGHADPSDLESVAVDAEGYPYTARSEEHTSELQSHRDLHSFPTRRSSDLHFGLHGAA